jgi:hypothetical protein
MEYNLVHFLVLGSLIVGAGITSFNIGVKHGAGAMFDYLWKSGDKAREDGEESVTVVLRK